MKRCQAKKIVFSKMAAYLTYQFCMTCIDSAYVGEFNLYHSLCRNDCLSNLPVLYDMCIDSAYVGNSTCTTAYAETIQYFAYRI